MALLFDKHGAIELNNIRATYMSHCYDFYKPDLANPFPIVDGKLTNVNYISSLDNCYQKIVTKYDEKVISKKKYKQNNATQPIM